jgi:hypothetical protein
MKYSRSIFDGVENSAIGCAICVQAKKRKLIPLHYNHLHSRREFFHGVSKWLVQISETRCPSLESQLVPMDDPSQEYDQTLTLHNPFCPIKWVQLFIFLLVGLNPKKRGT